jgi:peptidoglycan-associated lipoprotein
MALLATSLAFACHHTPPPATPVPPKPTEPPVAPAPTNTPAPIEDPYAKMSKMSVDELDRLRLFGEIHFDFDKSDVRDADKSVLQKNADVLKKYDFIKIKVEGYCDDRGTVEYNLALGDRRAKAALDYLVGLGVPPVQLQTVPYGKEFPVCSEHSEDCWARNRRDHFTVSEKIKK